MSLPHRCRLANSSSMRDPMLFNRRSVFDDAPPVGKADKAPDIDADSQTRHRCGTPCRLTGAPYTTLFRSSAQPTGPPTSMPTRKLVIDPSAGQGFGQLVVKVDHRLDPAEELRERELLVGRVDRVVGETDADQHLRQVQDTIEARNRPDRPADPDKDRRLPKAALHRSRRGDDRRMIARRRDGADVAGALDLDANAARGDPSQVVAHDALDVTGILIADEASRDLRLRPARDDRLRARSLVPAPYPVELERRSKPHPLERRAIAFAAAQRGRAQRSRLLFLVEGKRFQLGPLLRTQFRYALVKAGDDDAAALVFQCGDHRGQGLDRIAHGAAITAGMQIGGGTMDGDCPGDEPTQRDGQRGDVLGEDRRIGDDDEVACEPLALAGEERLEAGRSDLFFPFDDHFYVEWKASA